MNWIVSLAFMIELYYQLRRLSYVSSFLDWAFPCKPMQIDMILIAKIDKLCEWPGFACLNIEKKNVSKSLTR
jgi:hypothetical protein